MFKFAAFLLIAWLGMGGNAYAAGSANPVCVANEHTLAYYCPAEGSNGAGGVEKLLKEIDILFGETITLPQLSELGTECVTPDNKIFAGWQDDDNKATYVAGADFTLIESKDVKMTAIFADNDSAKIFYNPNYGNINDSSYSTTCTTTSQKIVLPTDVTRTGYTFIGWYDTNGYKVETLDRDLCVKDTIINLTANWQANEITVTFDANGATSGDALPQGPTCYYDGTCTAAAQGTLAKTNAVFLGWAKDKNANSAEYTPGVSIENITTGAPITLYAVWSQCPAAVAGAGVESAALDGVVGNVCKYTHVCKTGYYNANHNAQIDSTTMTCSACTNLPANAVWTGAATTNTCAWDCNACLAGDNAVSCDVTKNESARTCTYTGTCAKNTFKPTASGVTVSCTACPTNSTADAGNNATSCTCLPNYSVGGTPSGATTTTSTQCSPINYAIKYVLDSGTNYTGAPTTYTYGVGTTINGMPSKSGFIFGGWCDSGNVNCAYEREISTIATGTQTFYAKWTQATCTATNATATAAVADNTVVCAVTCNDGFTKGGAGDTTRAFNVTGEKNVANVDVECKIATHTITINKNGGSGVLTAHNYTSSGTADLKITCNHGDTVELPTWNNATNALTKSNSVFTGWDSTSSVACDADKTVNAQWSMCETCAQGNGVTECTVNVTNNVCVASATCGSGYGAPVCNGLSCECSNNVYECVAGKYLKAGATSCATCPGNSYCGGGTYAYNTTKDQGIEGCPADYPNSASGAEVITECYSGTKSRAWTGAQVNGVIPENCAAVTEWNACSIAACDYVAYSNTAGTGDGTIKSGCATNNDSCTKTVKSVSAQAGAYVNGTTCAVCTGNNISTGGNVTSCTACQTGYTANTEKTACDANCNVITLNPNNGTSGSRSTLYKKTGDTTWYKDANCTSEYVAADYSSVVPSRSGWTFRGFYLNSENATDISATQTNGAARHLTQNGGYGSTGGAGWSITSDATLYAGWAKNCAAGANCTCTLTVGQNTVYETSADAGYNIKSGDSMNAPVCEVITYDIEYTLNGGTNYSGAPTSYNVETTITLGTPTRANSTFGGWYTEVSFVNKETQIAKGSTGNKVFYAKWTCNDGYAANDDNTACNGNVITLSWANGGFGTAPTAPASCNYGDTFTMPVAMTATGHTFSAWSVNSKTFAAGVDVKCNKDNLGVTSGTATITGVWDTDSYTCVAGTYLKAGATSCATCPGNSYCGGGTYTYNTTKDQGIEGCPADYPNSDAGAKGSGECYVVRTNTGTEIPPALPEGCFAQAVGTCDKPTCNYKDYAGQTGETCNPGTCQQVHESCTSASVNYYLDNGVAKTCSSYDINYPMSSGGVSTSDQCYGTFTKTGNKIEDAIPTNCASVTDWNDCNPGTCEYTMYADKTIRIDCTPADCTLTPKSVTAKPGAIVNGAKCVLCGNLLYSPGGTSTKCTVCDGCVACDNTNGKCSSCLAGYGLNNNACNKCTDNTYSIGGTNACKACGVGYTANSGHTACDANKYMVSYSCGEGTGAAPGAAEVTYDENFTPATSTCTLDGYTFTGWMVSGTTESKTAGVAFNWKYTENKTFTAQWTPNTITLSWANGGFGTAPTAPASCNYGDTFTMPVAMTATGHTFSAWSVNSKTFAAGADVKCNKDNLGVTSGTATITGVWDTDSYTCVAGTYLKAGATSCTKCTADSFCAGGTYAYNTGKDQGVEGCPADYPNSASGAVGSTYCYATCADKTGYTYVSGVDYNGAADTCEYTANKYTVIYACGDGKLVSGVDSIQDVTYDDLFTTKAGTICEREGYTFVRWMGAYDKAGMEYTYTTAGNTTLTAQWTPNTITLSWNNGGFGTAPTAPDSCSYGSVFTAPAAMTATGHTFSAWSVDGKTFAAGAGVKCNKDNLGVTSGTATITGVWDTDSYTCVAGTYLKAGATSCATCPGNSYCGGGTYAYNTGKDQGIEGCPADYPNSASGAKVITECYSGTKSRAWTGAQVNGVIPENCAAVTEWNACSIAACDYVAYSNTAGTGDGTIKSGCATNNDSCTKTVKSVSAKANYYANGVVCSACPADYPSSAAGAVSVNKCYAGCEGYNVVGGKAVPDSVTVFYGNVCTYHGVSNTGNPCLLEQQNGKEVCVEVSCNPDYEFVSGACRRCERENAVSYLPNGNCQVAKCHTGFHPVADECVPDVQECSLPNAYYAEQVWDSELNRFGACTAIECQNDYHLDSGACVQNTTACEVEHGVGTREWDEYRGKWSDCIATSCDAGYTNDVYESANPAQQCGRCKNATGVMGEQAVSTYSEGCTIAACMYQGELYNLENNECVPICPRDTYADETGAIRWNPDTKKCERTCFDGYMPW